MAGPVVCANACVVLTEKRMTSFFLLLLIAHGYKSHISKESINLSRVKHFAVTIHQAFFSQISNLALAFGATHNGLPAECSMMQFYCLNNTSNQ